MTKEEFIEYRSQFKTNLECAKALKLTKNQFYELKKSLGLTKEYDYSNIDENKFLQLWGQGLNDQQIAKEFNVNSKRICALRHKLNLENNTKKHLSFNEEQLQIFLGGMLGDGSMLIPNDCKNAYYCFAHSFKQKEYALWKYNFIREMCFNPREDHVFDKRTNKVYDRIDIKTYTNELFTQYYDKFYKIVNGKKVKYINKEILYQLTELGIAIWFMDDGYKHHQGYALSTNCYSEEDLEIIIQFFTEKYQIHPSIHSGNVLYIHAKDRDKFTKIVKPYIQPEVMYKLHSKCPE